jgi:hypothetical protein
MGKISTKKNIRREYEWSHQVGPPVYLCLYLVSSIELENLFMGLIFHVPLGMSKCPYTYLILYLHKPFDRLLKSSTPSIALKEITLMYLGIM